MSWAFIGLLVQLIGIVIAGWALVTEWRSKPHLPEGQKVKSARKRENPWAAPLATKVPRVSRFDRERYERPRDLGGSRGSHPETLALAEWVASVLREYLGRAAADWDRQAVLDDQLRRADEELRQSQTESLATQHAATRQRVLIEMLGLVVVAVGTIISSA